MNALANSNFFEVKYIFEEKVSGFKDDRTEFKKLEKLTKNDIDIILIIDTSGSMGGTIESVKSAAIQLSERFYENFENARIALISFESNATLQTDFTKDKSLLKVPPNSEFVQRLRSPVCS